MERDILVIGTGILGLSSAYHLKKQNPEKKVVAIDMYKSPGQGNTAKSNACFRNVFTSQTNYLLADSTINWFYHLQNDLGYDLNLAQIGYLWLFSDEQFSRLKNAFNTIKSRGVELRILSREELERKIPNLNTNFEGDEEAELMDLEPVDVGVLGVRCGAINADALVRSYEAEFLKLGGEIKYNTTAKKLILDPERKFGFPGEPLVWQKKRIIGAETSYGKIIAATTVLAAGVWSTRLLEQIGVDSIFKPKKRQIFVFKDPRLKGLMAVKKLNEHDVLPLTMLPKAGIFLRGESTEGSIWLGCSDDMGRKFGLEDDPQPENEFFTNNFYHVLVKYFPCFKDVRPRNMWAGQYALNSFDMIPIVTSAPGMIYVGASSGSGITKCDALGRVVAALHKGEKDASLFGGRCFKVANIGLSKRNIEREFFII